MDCPPVAFSTKEGDRKMNPATHGVEANCALLGNASTCPNGITPPPRKAHIRHLYPGRERYLRFPISLPRSTMLAFRAREQSDRSVVAQVTTHGKVCHMKTVCRSCGDSFSSRSLPVQQVSRLKSRSASIRDYPCSIAVEEVRSKAGSPPVTLRRLRARRRGLGAAAGAGSSGSGRVVRSARGGRLPAGHRHVIGADGGDALGVSELAGVRAG